LYDVTRDDSESFKDETFGYEYGVLGASILQWTCLNWTFALLTLPCLDMCLLLKWNMSFDVSNAFDKS
jgi:hypothetical protein